MLLPGLHRTQTSRVLQRLEDLNLLTLGAIASVSLAHLQIAIGPPAGLLHDWALGIDPSPVHPPIAQPMIERSLHLDPDEVDDRLLVGLLYRLSEQICAMLLEQQRMCRHISLTVRHSNHVEQIAHKTLPSRHLLGSRSPAGADKLILPMFPSPGASHTVEASGPSAGTTGPATFALRRVGICRASPLSSPLVGTGSNLREIRRTSLVLGKDVTMTAIQFVHVHSDYFGLFADTRRVTAERTLSLSTAARIAGHGLDRYERIVRSDSLC